MIDHADHTFVHHFHVTKSQFEYLVKLHDNGMEWQYSHSTPEVPATKKVLIFQNSLPNSFYEIA